MLSLGIWSEAGEDGVTNGERFGVPAVSAISSVGSGLTLAGEMVILEGVKGETPTKGSCSGATALPKFLASIVRREWCLSLQETNDVDIIVVSSSLLGLSR
jgi:hypothetical protein